MTAKSYVPCPRCRRLVEGALGDTTLSFKCTPACGWSWTVAFERVEVKRPSCARCGGPVRVRHSDKGPYYMLDVAGDRICSACWKATDRTSWFWGTMP